MSIPIEMESLQHELRVKDMNQSNIVEGEWKKKSKRQVVKMQQDQHKYNLEDDWDQYQSD